MCAGSLLPLQYTEDEMNFVYGSHSIKRAFSRVHNPTYAICVRAYIYMEILFKIRTLCHLSASVY